MEKILTDCWRWTIAKNLLYAELTGTHPFWLIVNNQHVDSFRQDRTARQNKTSSNYDARSMKRRQMAY